MVGGRKYFDAVHRSIGDEDAFVCEVVGDAAMARLARRIIQRRDGVGARVAGARE